MRILLTLLLAFALAMPAGFALAEPTAAGEESQPHVILAGESEIEKLSAAAAQAQAKLDEANVKAAEVQAEIDAVEAQLPRQQALSDAGMRQRYIMQSNPLAIVDSLLTAESLGDFLRHVDYLEIISRSSLQELNRLRVLKASLDASRELQARLVADAQAALDEADSALNAMRETRAQAQRRGIEAAISQANDQGGEKSVGKAHDGGKQPDDYKEAANADTTALSDGADWGMSADDFIAEWAPRIDAYLQGSPLEGQGANFAAAAWKHGVDPRWSPAISNTESSKGAICIRPHNAWGWGAADSDPYGLALEWKSWEEAIDAHVAGLAQGYGYTISMNNAKKYCPNTWQSWYNRTLQQMSEI